MKKKRFFEESLSMASMAMLVMISLANVLTRYFTDQSFAWTEEISVFLLVVMTLSGAASAAGRDQHIRIEFFYDSGSAQRQQRLHMVSACCTLLAFLILSVLFSKLVFDEYRYGETTMGLDLPRWWFSAPIVPLCLLIAWRAWRATRNEAQSQGN
jgi:TRAP-type transport system small permease protein